MTTTKTHAFWNINLECDYPNCKESVDLLDNPDFWDGKKLEACENGTNRSRDVEVTCPECGHEFVVDLK